MPDSSAGTKELYSASIPVLWESIGPEFPQRKIVPCGTVGIDFRGGDSSGGEMFHVEHSSRAGLI